jgi:hypothetical protein
VIVVMHNRKILDRRFGHQVGAAVPTFECGSVPCFLFMLDRSRPRLRIASAGEGACAPLPSNESEHHPRFRFVDLPFPGCVQFLIEIEIEIHFQNPLCSRP